VQRIVSTLSKSPRSKDSDQVLIANLWNAELKRIFNKPTTEISAFDLLQTFVSGELSTTESIRRIRQKMQEEYPELRGSKYGKRHKHKDTIRETINKAGNEQVKYSI
jgi:hypothetical protein